MPRKIGARTQHKNSFWKGCGLSRDSGLNIEYISNRKSKHGDTLPWIYTFPNYKSRIGRLSLLSCCSLFRFFFHSLLCFYRGEPIRERSYRIRRQYHCQ